MPEPLRFPDRPDLPLDRPRIMGIVNATPDSFSDGGRYNDPEAAAAHALAMVDEGVEIIDVGGESTRPGSSRVEVDQQIARTAGVVAAIRKALDNAGHDAVVISIDTTRAEVASAALEAGASMLNDVAAGREDPAMLTLAAEQGRPICLMHMQGEPGNMQDNPTYDDVVGEVEAFLLERRAAAEAAGVERSQILLDPGIGFGKRTNHNL
ncbi:MAG: dihydropteroate synthase, partial [Phycisphaeraceae bacterium]|nr:dihydropteroate synthase [Phycisphaeraceae bacterium]